MKLLSIQLMRGVAAVMVLYFHTTSIIGDSFLDFSVSNTGAAGVDVFFVISGFIMVYTNWNHFGKRGASSAFTIARLTRIVPLYYLFTTLVLLILVFAPQLYRTLRYDLSFVLSSYAFILSENTSGIPGTLVGVGWTLTFEAFFYVIFAVLLNFKRKYFLFSLSLIFVVGVCVGTVTRNLPTWSIVMTNPLVFEFLMGCVLGYLFRLDVQFSPLVSISILISGIIGLILAGSFGAVHSFLDLPRVVFFGIPSFLIVGGIVFFEKAVPLKIPAPLLLIGDSSYSLYLSHGFTLKGISLGLLPVLLKLGVSSSLLILILMSLSIFVALLFYYLFEKPVSKMLKVSRISRVSVKPPSIA